MPFTTQTLLENRIVVLTLDGVFSVEAAQQFNAYMLAHLTMHSATTHLIADITQARQMPSHIPELKGAFSYLRQPGMGWLIVVNSSPNPLANMLAAVITKAAGVNMRFAKTMDEALDALRRLDLTLTE